MSFPYFGPITLDSVEFTPGGDLFTAFYQPTSVTNLQLTGTPGTLEVVNGNTVVATYAGVPATFEPFMTTALQNLNLNHYINIGNQQSFFSYDVLFSTEVFDDNPMMFDAQGEILVSERGGITGGTPGNSFITFTALDAMGLPIGVPFVLSPDLYQPLSPGQTVLSSQPIGMAAIDLSLMGVSSLWGVRLSTAAVISPPGGDSAPDGVVLGVNTLQFIPEPASLLLLIGAAPLLARRRRSA